MPKKIDDKVRARAVQMVQGGRALQEIADSLDVSVSYVTKLKAQLDAGGLPTGRTPSESGLVVPRKRKHKAPPAPVLSVSDQLLQPDTLTRLSNELHDMRVQRAALDTRIAQADALVKALTPKTSTDQRQLTVSDQLNRSNLQQGSLAGSQLNQDAEAFEAQRRRSQLTGEAPQTRGPVPAHEAYPDGFGGSEFP